MDVLSLLGELRERGEAVVLATVVASRRPASARPGDRALVLESGELVGWIGGSCAQPTVQREGLHALADGKPRLIRLSPEAGLLPSEEGVVEAAMTCHSGGSLEIYVEPFLPAPWLMVTGDSPIAEALARLASLDDFRVRREVPDGALPGGERYVVVAGMSGEDEQDLELVLALDPSYVAFVGSRKRLAEVTARLAERGVSPELLRRVKGPAGLDIGALTAVEIAVSIMAEIVQHRRRRAGSAPARPAAEPTVAVAEAIDPVCGMRVAVRGARQVYEHHGTPYYFCCPSCRRLFAADPGQYLNADRSSPAPAGAEVG